MIILHYTICDSKNQEKCFKESVPKNKPRSLYHHRRKYKEMR